MSQKQNALVARWPNRGGPQPCGMRPCHGPRPEPKLELSTGLIRSLSLSLRGSTRKGPRKKGTEPPDGGRHGRHGGRGANSDLRRNGVALNQCGLCEPVAWVRSPARGGVRGSTPITRIHFVCAAVLPLRSRACCVTQNCSTLHPEHLQLFDRATGTTLDGHAARLCAQSAAPQQHRCAEHPARRSSASAPPSQGPIHTHTGQPSRAHLRR